MTAAATRRRTRSLVVAALALGLGLLLLEIAALLVVQRLVDATEQVSGDRLIVALQTFRPSPTDGRAQPVPTAELDPARAARSVPADCGALSRLSNGTALDGGTWTGVSGSPRQPVTILAVRYADSGAARSALTEKRFALLRCRVVQLTFPPFDAPPQTFRSAYDPLALVTPDRLGYRLVSDRYGYDFYVRRWGNTLTWTYSPDPVRTRVSRAVVDDLATRFAALARE